jgi:hypothetical protein
MQSVLTQLGLTDRGARALLTSEVQTSGEGGYSSTLAIAGRAAYLRVPEAARGAATTALFAWAQAYVNSPEFETAYARIRSESKPQLRERAPTVEEALKKQLDESLAAYESAKTAASAMPAAEREKYLASLKQIFDMQRSPETQRLLRAGLEEECAKGQAGEDQVMARWQERFPADRQVLFARRLREFLDATADVDFEARKNTIRNPAGETVGFVLSDAHKAKPWQWLDAFVVGKEATTAARAAAGAWLKELGATSSTMSAFKVPFSATF